MWRSINEGVGRTSAPMLGAKVEEKADPKIQLEQAIEEAKKRHEALTQQAAAVLGNERRLELKQSRTLEKVNACRGAPVRHWSRLDQARAAGDGARAATFDQAAQSFALQLVTEENTAREQQGAARASEGRLGGALARRSRPTP